MAKAPAADPDAILRGLGLLTRAVATNSERLAAMEAQLATLVAALSQKEGEPNPLHEVLERIIHLQEQSEAKLDRLLRLAETGFVNGGTRPLC